MADVTISPNMGLPIPTVGEAPGPDWAAAINACMTAIDSHKHVAGQGVNINPDGININSDLPINNFNVISARTYRFTPQVSSVGNPSDIGCLQEIGVDLYYIDGAGNNIRITQSGSLAGAAGTITGLPSGTASASFAAGTFTFQSATSTPAALAVGPVTIGQAVASGFGVTVSANAGQAANYALSLPTTLPASTKILTVDNSGNVGDSLYVDNSSIEVSGNNIQIKDLGVTYPKLSALNYFTTSGSGVFASSSTSYVDVTNLSQSITVTGSSRGVWIVFRSDDAAPGFDGAFIRSTGTGATNYQLQRNGVAVNTSSLGTSGSTYIPPGSLNFFDPGLSPGNYVYKLRAKSSGGINVNVVYVKMLVFEI